MTWKMWGVSHVSGVPVAAMAVIFFPFVTTAWLPGTPRNRGHTMGNFPTIGFFSGGEARGSLIPQERTQCEGKLAKPLRGNKSQREQVPGGSPGIWNPLIFTFGGRLQGEIKGSKIPVSTAAAVTSRCHMAGLTLGFLRNPRPKTGTKVSLVDSSVSQVSRGHVVTAKD